MKAWARKFYHSKKWLKVRSLAMIRDNKLCNRCEKPAYMVHHTIKLTAKNINDPMIALNLDLLECLCKECHDEEHEFGQRKNTVNGLRFDADGNIIELGKHQ